MSYTGILEALVDRIQAVHSTAKVHGFYRWSTEAPGLSAPIALFGAPLNTWMLTRTARTDEKAPSDDSRYRVQHTLQLWHYFAHNDANESEATFQAAVDAVMDDLRDGDRTLGGECLTLLPPVAPSLGLADFGGVLCHEASMVIVVEEVV